MGVNLLEGTQFHSILVAKDESAAMELKCGCLFATEAKVINSKQTKIALLRVTCWKNSKLLGALFAARK
jgi:hypothetical protein